MKPITFAIAIMGMLMLPWNRVNAQYYAAATPESAALDGLGDVIRSQGMYNQMTGAGMWNYEQARGKYIENQRQWTDLYLTRNRILAAQHAQALEFARERNRRLLDDLAARPSHLPPRLQSASLDRLTGRVDWPPALMRDAFTIDRVEMESLLAERGQKGSSSELNSAIFSKVKDLQDDLREHIREIVPQEYMDARKFLSSLMLEGQFPIQVEHQTTAQR